MIRENIRGNNQIVKIGVDGPYTGFTPSELTKNSFTSPGLFTRENITYTTRRAGLIPLIELPIDSGITEQARQILNRLRIDSLYIPDLLFSGFEGQYAQNVIETGKNNPRKQTIFCSTEPELSQVYFSA